VATISLAVGHMFRDTSKHIQMEIHGIIERVYTVGKKSKIVF
jgi:2-keto-3-deoxy-L-rhamnonate aldolase RhmA